MTAADRRLAIATEEQRLEGFGLSRTFAERANRAEPGSMWYPPNDELLRERVITRILVATSSTPKAAEPSADATTSGQDTAMGQSARAGAASNASRPDLGIAETGAAASPDAAGRAPAGPPQSQGSARTGAPGTR